MLRFILQRITQIILTLLLLSIFLFFIIYVIGSPVYIFAQPDADFLEIERLQTALGLNQPLYKQYYIFIQKLLQGNLGVSYYYNMPVMSVIVERLPATIELTVMAFFIAFFIGFPIGVWAGFQNEKQPLNRVLTVGSLVGFSMPNFWQALLLIMFFSVFLQWFPSFGRGETVTFFQTEWSFATVDGLRHLILPAINLAIFKICLFFRMTKSHIYELKKQKFYFYARARGLHNFQIFRYHILKSLSFLLITVFTVEFVSLIVVASITESMFSWPGIGKLLIDAILVLDRPLVVSFLLLTVMIFIITHFFVDMFYMLIDPRYKFELQEKKII